MNPLQLFNNWYRQEKEKNTCRLQSACCLSTIGLDGYPNARMVSLRAVKNDLFVFTGSVTSKKGLELQYVNKAALTFWWPFTEKQVRIQGVVHFMRTAEADLWFGELSREQQLVACISAQSEETMYPEILEIKYHQASQLYAGKSIERPLNSGGFLLQPEGIEFMSCTAPDLNPRIEFRKNQGLWETRFLQP